jgi:hypothetical protein
MVEGLVEDPHRRHVLERRQVLPPEDEDLVSPEGLPQGLRGDLVNGLGQVHALDLGPDQGTGRAGFECSRVTFRSKMDVSGA